MTTYGCNTSVEGLVNVHVAEITTKLAFPALTHKLEAQGFVLNEDDFLRNRYRFELHQNDVSSLVQTLNEFVFADWQYAYLENRLARVYSYLTDDEQEYLALLTFHGLKNFEGDFAGKLLEEWQLALTEVFREMINCNQLIDLDGILRFRLRDYLEAVDIGLDETV